MVRVQTADLATVEQNVGLIDPLALQLLGVDDGDELVIQGSPNGGGLVPIARMRVLAAPEEVLARRQNLSGGSLATRFPSAAESIGVHPDIPWIFLDSAVRSSLGLAGTKLGAVRIRASRRFQVYREIRELLLLLVLAFVGLASVIRSTPVLLLVLVCVLAAAAFVMRHRLKQRLEAER